MKINNNSINAVNAYINAANSTKAKKSGKTADRKNVDTAQFSPAAKSAAMQQSSGVTRANALNDTASPERIAALKAMVSSGSYHVSSEDIASSVTDF